eukprot:767688-Hanusia_phi.AAC.1
MNTCVAKLMTLWRRWFMCDQMTLGRCCFMTLKGVVFGCHQMPLGKTTLWRWHTRRSQSQQTEVDQSDRGCRLGCRLGCVGEMPLWKMFLFVILLCVRSDDIVEVILFVCDQMPLSATQRGPVTFCRTGLSPTSFHHLPKLPAPAPPTFFFFKAS